MLEKISKDEAKCMYDYADDYYDIRKLIESEEKRKMTFEESMILLSILSDEEG